MWRRSRRYSPFDRSHGLRRLPDDGIGLAFIGSILLHAALILGLVRATAAPPWPPNAATSLVSFGDLVASVPANPDRTEVEPGMRARPSAPSVPPAPTGRTSTMSTSAHRDSGRAAAASPSSTSAPSAGSLRATPPDSEPAVAAPAPAIHTDGPVLLSASEMANTRDGGPPAPLRSAVDPALASPASVIESAAPAQSLTPVPVIASSPVPELLSIPLIEPRPPLETAPLPRADLPPPPLADPPRVAVRPLDVVPAIPPGAGEAAGNARPASPLGLGLGRALVRLDGPRERVTDRPTETISGRLLGGSAERIVLYVNGEPITVTPTQRAFELSVPLQPGPNRLRAVATNTAGLETEDVIGVQYVPPPPIGGIVLTTPADNLTLGPDDPPIVVVEGQVEDQGIGTVWIVANDRRVAVPAREGRFRKALVVSEPLLRLWAETEASANGGPPRRSETLTVRSTGATTSTGVLVVQWPLGMESSDVEVSATWRAQADRLDAPAQTVRLAALAKAGDGAPAEIFYLRGVKPGVYTLAVRSRGTVPSTDIRSTLYVPAKIGFSARPLAPARLNGGRTVLTRILMPYGILWTQDDWFSGLSESVDTVTKFRVPEGISWVERKVDLQ
jgi:hypothetical protein